MTIWKLGEREGAAAKDRDEAYDDTRENRDRDDDHFENEAVRLSLGADRFAIDWSNPIEVYVRRAVCTQV